MASSTRQRIQSTSSSQSKSFELVFSTNQDRNYSACRKHHADKISSTVLNLFKNSRLLS